MNTIPAVVTVTVNSIPTISVNSGTVCQGQNFIMIPSGASSYTFSNGSATVTPTVNSSYTVSGTSSAGCISTISAVANVTLLTAPIITASGGVICTGNSFTIVPNGAVNYTYSSGTNVVSPVASTSYSVSGSNTLGCVSLSPAVIIVTVNALPVIIANSGSVCSGKSFTINPSGANSYTYSSVSNIVTPSITTTYSVTGTNSNNCVTNVPTLVQVLVLLNPTITVNSTAVICSGNSYTISPSGGVTYSYSGGSNIVNPLTTTVYTITGASAQGCSGTALITVSVQPSLSLSIAGTTIACEGESYTLICSGANSYTWSTGVISNSIIITPSTTTVYSVSADGGNCLGSTSHSVILNLKPIVSAFSSSSLICAEETVTLFASGANTYTWSTGAIANSITVIPLVTSTYSLVGSDLNNCINSAVYTQSVDACVGLINRLNKQQGAIDVYPNPSNGEVTVSFENIIDKPMIELYNYLGQLIIKENVIALKTILNFKTVANGVYTLRVISYNKTVFTEKIIKQE